MYIKTSSGVRVMVDVFCDEEKRRVVAIARGCEYVAIESLNKVNRRMLPIAPKANTHLFNSIVMKSSYSGVAKCHPDDEFVYQVGRKVALNKLKAKLDEKVARRIDTMSKELEKYSKELSNFKALLSC